MKIIFCVLFLCIALLTQSPSSQATIYKYVDDTGRMHFVDDEEMIPTKYRQGTTYVNELPETRSTEEIVTQEEEKTEQIYDRNLHEEAIHEAKQQEKRRAYQTPAMVSGNRIRIPVEVSRNNQKAHLVLVLDAETETTIFYRNALAELKLLSDEIVMFSYVDIGPFHKENIHIRMTEPKAPQLPYDGVLGMDFLKNHPYRIDFENEMIHWNID